MALARKIFGRLDGRRVLVVGAGEISTLTAQHLRSARRRRDRRHQPHAAHAEALAASVGGRSIAVGRARPRRWPPPTSSSPATGSQRPIITRAQVEAVTGRHRRDPLFIIDVAVPRDVDPAVGDIEQVFLYNVDDLQTIVQENLSRRGAEIERAEAIVARNWRGSRRGSGRAARFRRSWRCAAVRRDPPAELQRLEGKLAALPPDARARSTK